MSRGAHSGRSLTLPTPDRYENRLLRRRHWTKRCLTVVTLELALVEMPIDVVSGLNHLVSHANRTISTV